jgi:hypothetical protein
MFTNKVIPFLGCVFFSTVCFSSLDEIKDTREGTEIEREECFCDPKDVYWLLTKVCCRCCSQNKDSWRCSSDPMDRYKIGRLHWCRDQGFREDFGFVVHSQDVDKNTPLHNAKTVQQVQNLLWANARVYEFKNRLGRSVMEHYAVGAELIKSGLLSNGAPYDQMLKEIFKTCHPADGFPYKPEIGDTFALKYYKDYLNDYSNYDGSVADVRK